MELTALLGEIKRRLADAFGDRLEGVVLFGSEARGEAREDSDLDILVLLRGPVRVWNDICRGVDATYPLTLASGRPIHLYPGDVRRWEEGVFPPYREARAEGRLL